MVAEMSVYEVLPTLYSDQTLTRPRTKVVSCLPCRARTACAPVNQEKIMSYTINPCATCENKENRSPEFFPHVPHQMQLFQVYRP